MKKTYLLIDSENTIVNAVVWDGDERTWRPPGGLTAVESDAPWQPGWKWDGELGVAVDPVPPPPPPPPPAPAREPSLRERFNSAVSDAYFDFDKSDIRDDARVALTRAAEFLRANPTVTIQIEGHCDERGSVAYNLGLGDRRANSARDFLISLGVSGDRITTISYGKERPFCTESTEQCWQQNRRAHLVCTNCGQ